MALALSTFGIAFAAFGVWVTVRIINRPEQWTKWVAVALIVTLLAYPLMVGTAAWVRIRVPLPNWARPFVTAVILPLMVPAEYGPRWLSEAISSYVAWWESQAGRGTPLDVSGISG